MLKFLFVFDLWLIGYGLVYVLLICGFLCLVFKGLGMGLNCCEVLLLESWLLLVNCFGLIMGLVVLLVFCGWFCVFGGCSDKLLLKCFWGWINLFLVILFGMVFGILLWFGLVVGGSNGGVLVWLLFGFEFIFFEFWRFWLGIVELFWLIWLMSGLLGCLFGC